MVLSTRLTRNDFGKYAQQARTVGGTASKETAEKIRADAEERVHKITGATARSGRVEQTGLGYDVIFEEGAIFEEYGTVHRPPHPFLTPASEAQRSGAFERLRRALEL